jgi:hypothetical protein
MRDATYVVLALALCMIASVFMVQTITAYRPEISIFELKEFAQLPIEIRNVLRRFLIPDQTLSRQQWASMNPYQRHAIIEHMTSMFQQRFAPPPSSYEKEELPVLIPPTPVPNPEPEPEPEQSPVVHEEEDSGIKKGFLLTESKKTHSKNKKKDKAETLVEVVAPPEEPPATPSRRRSGGSDSGFLGGDE